MFVAKRVLDLGTRTVHYGDPVPEAATWPNLRSYINLGWIEEVPDVQAEPSPPEKAPAADEPQERPAVAAASATPAAQGRRSNSHRTGHRPGKQR
ncbi:MAG: hypothetical protein ACM3US_09830 [Sphingomonadaceae bacterium]